MITSHKKLKGQMSSFLRQGLEHLPQAVPERSAYGSAEAIYAASFSRNDTIYDCVER